MVKKTVAASTEIAKQPKLAKGEEYIGILPDGNGGQYHLILLPGDERKKWKNATARAKKKGGDLPDRVEQALLHRDHKAKFQQAWYWSNTPCAGTADGAWVQSFDDGYQGTTLKSGVYRCRAVRRVAI